jgi:hypothetical protein
MKDIFEKKRDNTIKKIKKGIAVLTALGYTIESQPTETMIGSVVDHIYARIRGNKENSQSIYEQKFLFTLSKGVKKRILPLLRKQYLPQKILNYSTSQ